MPKLIQITCPCEREMTLHIPEGATELTCVVCRQTIHEDAAQPVTAEADPTGDAKSGPGAAVAAAVETSPPAAALKEGA